MRKRSDDDRQFHKKKEGKIEGNNKREEGEDKPNRGNETTTRTTKNSDQLSKLLKLPGSKLPEERFTKKYLPKARH